MKIIWLILFILLNGIIISGEENVVVGTITGKSSSSNYNNQLGFFSGDGVDNDLSEEHIRCKKAKGCWDDIGCHQVGYIKDGTYCYYTGKTTTYSAGRFLNQSETGKLCIKNYECATNICLEGVCINRTEEINSQIDIKLEELKQNIVNKIEEEIEKINESEEIYMDIESDEVKVDKNIIEKVLNWIKNIFS